MDRAQVERIYVTLFFLLIVGIWYVAALIPVAPSYLLPSPGEVIDRLYTLYADGMLMPSIQMTFVRMITGFLLAASIGLALGLLMSISTLLARALRSFFLGVQTLPTAAWVPLAILIFGLKDSGIWFVIIMSCFPAVAIATCDGIARVAPLWIKVGQTYGLTQFRMVREILVPASFPTIITGLRMGWTLGWHGAVSAELIKSSAGLGFLLHMGREMQDMSQVIGIMLLTILFGLLIDRLVFMTIERRIAKQWGLIL